MEDLKQYREEITKIDKEMAELFESRMRISAKIAEYKKEHGLPIRDPKREEAMLSAYREYIKDPDMEEYYIRFLKNVVDISASCQERLF